MVAHPLASAHSRDLQHGDAPVAPLPHLPGRIALVLNHRARSVTGVLAKRLAALVGVHHVYASHTMQQAASLSETLVQRGYDTVVCAGGDGTFIGAVNHILRHGEALPARRRPALPAFAFLALGTGNALRHTAGGRDPVADLARLVRGEATAYVDLPLIEGPQGERFVFGGLGYDSMILSDYTWLCDRVSRGPARPLVRSLAGYIAALCARTLPRLVMAPNALAAKITLNAPGAYLDPERGDREVPLAAGAVIHEGPVGMLGAGTTPYYGYGLKIFPFAGQLGNRMQLRLVTLSPAQALAHLPAMWRGVYRHGQNVRDFAASDVTVALARPHPFQHSGEDRGTVAQLRLRMGPQPLRLIRFDGAHA